jgi:ArsR family transcriptional regulator, arsenate/arsenite/antimonite-responsive transcriptional repressor
MSFFDPWRLGLRTNILSLSVEPITRLFRALGDETRVRIVALLSQGELCVCHIEAALEISQPNASRQLSVLRAAGVVTRRRDGNWTYYRLSDPPDEESRRVLRSLKRMAARDLLRDDIDRLKRATGPGACE